jgi:hypothetical protein
MNCRLAVALLIILVAAAITVAGIDRMAELTWSPGSLPTLAALAAAAAAWR